jgi:polar amino acid transport system permease protein
MAGSEVSTSEPSAGTPERPEDIKAVPVRRPGRWIASVIVLAIGASIVRSVITNPNFHWGIVGHYLFDPRVLHGIVGTLLLTVISMAIGIALGIVIAVMRQSPNPLLSGSSWLYIWFLRGTPLLVQIVFWNFIAALYPVIAIGIPFGPALIHGNANTVISTFDAAILALGLNEGAYMAEIVRAGFLAVDEGQSEAAASLGMSRLQIMRHIVLPQAMRVILPPTGNETISMLKNTSLVYFIGYAELFYEVSQIYGANYETIPLLIVASIWYLVMTSIAYVGQYFIERHYGRGFTRAQKGTMAGRWLGLGQGGGGEGAVL